MSARKAALGKGLEALLSARPVSVAGRFGSGLTSPAAATPGKGPGKDATPSAPPPPAAPEPPVAPPVVLEEAGRKVRSIKVEAISPNPFQPRQTFSEESLAELAASIRTHGVLQPVLVCADRLKEGRYVLIAGERRFRAAQLAGLSEVPALLAEVTEEEQLEIAIVENVQRDDLNPVEEARAYRQLIDRFGWAQDHIAERVGKNRSTVANALRLLKLSPETLEDLAAERLTAGHARAILSIEDEFYRQKLRAEIVQKGLSVREAERRAAEYKKAGSPLGQKSEKTSLGASERLDIVNLQERLIQHLGCRVRLNTRDGKSGSVKIPFRNLDELQKFLQAISLPEDGLS